MVVPTHTVHKDSLSTARQHFPNIVGRETLGSSDPFADLGKRRLPTVGERLESGEHQ